MAKRKIVRLLPRPTFLAHPTQKRPRLRAPSLWSSAWSTRCARTGGRRASVNMEISASSHMVWTSWRSVALPMDLSLPNPRTLFIPLQLHPQRTLTLSQNRLQKMSKRTSKKRLRWRKQRRKRRLSPFLKLLPKKFKKTVPKFWHPPSPPNKRQPKPPRQADRAWRPRISTSLLSKN